MGQPVIHFEIGCRDSAKAQAFYGQLFNWQIRDAGAAAMIDTGDAGGINGHITSLGHDPHNYMTVYVLVDHIEDYVAKAEALGGKKLIGPVEIPTGRFAWVNDPDGNILGLWENKPDA